MRGLVLAVAAALLSGCLTRRMPGPPAPPPIDVARPQPPKTGSLWHPELAINYPVLDVRAHFPGDLLTVVVAETSQGRKDASTDSTAESSISASVDEFFGIPKGAASFLPRGFNPEQIVSATSARDFKGEGETVRRGSLTASITVRVLAVDAAGNLHVRGDKVIRVNREDEHIVLSGVVRPEDIASDNTISSTRLADARIDYYGRGSVGDKQRVPLVHRLFDAVWPF